MNFVDNYQLIEKSPATKFRTETTFSAEKDRMLIDAQRYVQIEDKFCVQTQLSQWKHEFCSLHKCQKLCRTVRYCFEAQSKCTGKTHTV